MNSFFETIDVARGQRGHGPFQISSTLCHFLLCFYKQCPERILLVAERQSICHTDVTTVMQTSCVTLAPSHVTQYQAFHTTFSYLFNLPLTKSSQQRRTVRHCRTPMKSSIVILISQGLAIYRPRAGSGSQAKSTGPQSLNKL